MDKRGLLVILSGPAGSGKSTIADELIRRSQGEICRVVTATTRTPRPGEKPGRDYHFLPMERFRTGIQNSEYVEYNLFGTNYYGTPKKGLDEQLAQRKVVLLVVDVNGADAIRLSYPASLRIFVVPPCPDKLRERLSKRGTESHDEIESRLRIAEAEIARLETYDHLVINDDLDLAVLDTMTIIKVARAHHIRGGELSAWREGLYSNWHQRPHDL